MSKRAQLFRSASAGSSFDQCDRDDESIALRTFTLLFVDDEEGVARALKRIFMAENYRILTASNGFDALEILESDDVHLVISDYRMPGMSGAQLLKEIKTRWPAVIRIMLTGYADVQSVMGAVNEGAVYKFITKPWNDEDMRLTVSLALQQYVLMTENRKLRDLNEKQQETIKRYARQVAESSGILGTILAKSGQVSAEAYNRALRERHDGEFIIDTLVRLNLTNESRVVQALQKHLNLEFLDLKEVVVPPEVIRFLPRDLCEKSRLLPVKLQKGHLTLAMADPSDIYKIDNLSLMLGLKVTPVIASSAEILSQIIKVYGDRNRNEEISFEDIPELDPIDEIDIVIEEEERVNISELLSSSEVPPIIRIVNAVISEAIRYKASDVHIEPKTKFTVVRLRIDGMLNDKIRIPADLHAATVSRIKILAKMDISERRVPQDGRITVKSGARLVDLRVSTMPSINGEKVVLRILDKRAAVKKLDQLGLLEHDFMQIRALIKKPQGMIISTGPTGSGKTTMLYSILGEMLQRTKNFETIEDPVEYFLEEANQIFVRDKIGLTFASVLRATLRQDPDVILVGEIRDRETADVAFKAALTGHMVLTTLHTNSSVASITRLIDIGVPPYMIASAIEGILAQRLVRCLCPHCRVETDPDPEQLNLLKIPVEYLSGKVQWSVGCAKCDNTGYIGRTGVYELFVMNEDFRHIISSHYKEAEMVRLARSAGMKTLIEDGALKVKNGETTLDELLRVVGPQILHERECPACNRMIDAKVLFCPYCGCFKQDTCEKCQMAVEKDWKICGFCGEPLNGEGVSTFNVQGLKVQSQENQVQCSKFNVQS
jgi:type II secretory ATPase GspE/PulE/Tfp pilus assembly ATPase PilB-like protein/FixJ family two-component response regulator/RNA polymerase subunit RPABC4/transcription elongation factor Spt4